MIAYLDCFSGISGDMLLGALLDAGLSLEDLRADLSGLPLSGYEVTAERVTRGGLSGTRVQVKADRSHEQRNLQQILDIISRADLPPEVSRAAEKTFTRLAEAEARVHGSSIEQIHFHEVGAVDAIVDVVGAFSGFHRLGVETIHSSPLPLGGGWVETEHGPLPVPAPATVELLKACPACPGGVPTYGGPVEAELVTPTGAAILTTACQDFGPMPAMVVRQVGWGAGSRDLPRPNLLRLFLGEPAAMPREEQLALIETNLDDMNPELFEHVMDQLFSAGALDVFYTPIVMKKSRPATLISVLSEPVLVQTLSGILFRETTTLGVRVTEVARRCLDREWREVETEYGRVRVKIGRMEEQILSASPEYEDCVRVARERGVPVKLVYQAAQGAFRRAD